MYLYPPDVESSGEITALIQDRLNPQVLYTAGWLWRGNVQCTMACKAC